MPAPIPSKLDANQVLQHAFDDSTGRLRTDTVATITTPPAVEVSIDAATDSIKIGDGVDFLAINADGSINVNISGGTLSVNISHTDDSIRLGDGTSFITSTTVGPDVGLDVNVINQISGFATSANQLTEIASLSSLDSKLNSLGQKVMAGSVPVVIASDQSALSISLPSGAATEAKQDTQITKLTSIDTKLDNLDIRDLNASQDDVLVAGSEDGTSTGTLRWFVNNERQQILATQNRIQNISYADFGTKDQRITQIDYTSTIFPGITARKTMSYTLVGTKYRRDSITWSIV